MKVVIGSTNTPKHAAVKKSFSEAFPDEEIIVDKIQTDSGVSAHPVSAEESIKGASNRAYRAKELVPGADYYVGIEGGLLQVDDKFWELGWVVILNSFGKTSTSLSAGIELKGKILESISDGVELNDVLERDFGIKSAGNTNGFYGLATDNQVTRQAAYEQAITFALAAFIHPEFYSE